METKHYIQIVGPTVYGNYSQLLFNCSRIELEELLPVINKAVNGRPEALRDCPFCGKQPDIKWIFGDKARIECTNCKVYTISDKLEAVIRVWNRRSYK